MKAYIGYCTIGVLGFDEKGKLVDKELFKKDAKYISNNLNASKTEIITEETALINRLKKKGFDGFFGAYPKTGAVAIFMDHDNIGENNARSLFRKVALDEKWVESEAELNKMLSLIGIESSKTELRNTNKDRIGMRVVGIIDELDKNINVLTEHLREWYGLYFPEINGLVKDNKSFAEFVAEKTVREGFERNGKRLEIESAGMSFNENDLNSVKDAGKTLLALYNERTNLELYLNNLAKEVMPNTAVIAGPILAFKLTAQAGGLDKLAKLPSSTIQLLGAEKALFRFLKKKGKAPKHGIIFYHPAVISAPIPLRGKIARIVASKITLAARIDFFSGKDKSADIKKDLDELLANAISHFRA